MRLSDLEIESIISTLTPFIESSAELRLFGSRANISAKGGDIDLLLIVNTEPEEKNILFNKADILSRIKLQIGEQKTDLITTTGKNMHDDPFIRAILPGSITLKKW